MNSLIIRNEEGKVNGEIRLPASKSISNRLLVLREFSSGLISIDNLSCSDDTVTMMELLRKIQSTGSSRDIIELDCGPAGTVFRFLVSFLANRDGKWLLTGSDRLRERPVGPLVDALQAIGAEISYEGKTGYPPLLIRGKNLPGGNVQVDAGISSQFISSLLMLAPVLEKGLSITLKGQPVSEPYIRMTLTLLKQSGIFLLKRGNRIDIPGQSFRQKSFSVEPDWTSAAYWYEATALSKTSDVFLKGVTLSGLQGDSILPRIFKKLGVATITGRGGIRLVKTEDRVNQLELNLSGSPDLVMSIAVCCAGMNTGCYLTGLETLPFKESDRLASLSAGLRELGYGCETGPGMIRIHGTGRNSGGNGIPVIKTFHDHRIAMAFAPLALKIPAIEIDSPGVVTKSYPDFWDHMEQTGFKIQKV